MAVDISPAMLERLVATALRWLRPGGRLVIGDMMLGREGGARECESIA